MTILTSQRILIGASGWLHSGWQEQFYPEDLPQDWQLAYYGNEFSVVLIREQEWQQGEVENWLDETDDLPLFIAELPLTNSENVLHDAQTYLEKIRGLGERCMGIVCQLNATIGTDDLTVLLKQCNALAPTCVDISVDLDGELPSSLQKVLQDNRTNIVGKSSAEFSNVSGTLILINICTDELDLKILRKAMDSLLQHENKEGKEYQLVLLLNGEPPSMDLMKQAKVLLELL